MIISGLRRFIGVGFLCLFALLATSAHAATIEVSVSNTIFSPPSITIEKGDTVNWTWRGGSHSVTSGEPGSPDGIFESGVTAVVGTTFSVTFDDAFLAAHPTSNATYRYYCTIHGSMMIGSIKVNGVVTGPAPTPTPRPLFLSGKVLKGTKPLAGVKIKVGDKTTATNLTGSYIIDALSAGTYSVTGSRPGYAITSIDGTREVALSTNVTDHDFKAACSTGFIAKGLACINPRTPAPAAPRGISASVADAGVQIKIRTVPGATSYRVYRSTTEGEIGSVVVKSKKTTLTDTTATAGTTYYYVATALNGKAESLFSKQISVAR